MTFTSKLPSATQGPLAYGLTAALAVGIALLTLLPLATPPLSSEGGDKVYHFVAFAGLMLPVATLRPRALLWMIPAALLFGAGIEIIQPYVNRSRDVADFLADGAGVLAGSACGLAIHKLRVGHDRGVPKP